jgi:adenylate cyclase class IV
MSESNHEVELRLVIGDPPQLHSALVEAGATVIGQGLVRTSSFDFADGRLQNARQTLRLREDWTGTTLTAKVPLTSQQDEDAGQAKVREEINIPLPAEAGATMRRLLQSIGLRESLSYDKTRTSWRLGQARIDVDVLADGGACYAEIEAPAAEISRTRTTLGLDGAPVETRTYFEIVRLAREGKGQ